MKTFEKPLSAKEEKEYLEKYRNGDVRAGDVLIIRNMRLVAHMVKHYSLSDRETSELISIGTIGLIKAIDKFDLGQPVMLSTYAVPMISGEIKRFIRDDGMIKISRSIKENGWKIRKASEQLAKTNGREPTAGEISEFTGIPVEDIAIATTAGKEVESIYKTAYQSDGAQVYIVDKLAAVSEVPASEKLLNHMMLEQMIDSLDETEKCLIRMRYYEDCTQTQVADKLGISQVQVSRLEKKILMRMRKNIDL